ncbi:MAG: MarR family winged helix-turn-helix transcriptional regulator [Pseudomonadales bacterium]
MLLYLYRVRDEVYDEFCDAIVDFDIQPGDFETLATLRISNKNHELTPTEIYRTMLISSGGLTKILNRLEAGKFIKRFPNGRDQRSFLIKLSAKGKRVIEKAMDEVLKRQSLFLSVLTKKEQHTAQKILQKLSTRLDSL